MNIRDYMHYYVGQTFDYPSCGTRHKRVLNGYYLENPLNEMRLHLRPLDSMTEEEKIELFKKVSLISLDDYDFEFIDDERESGTWGVNALGVCGAVQDAIKWENSVLWAMNNDHTFSPINPQSDVFDWMVKKGFDLWNLIPRQLAIDSNTLTP